MSVKDEEVRQGRPQVVMRDPCHIMIKDSVPVVRAARNHFLRDELRWRRLIRIAPALKVDLERQEVSAGRRKSLFLTRGRARTRLSRTAGGKTRWRLNVACGRPVRSIMTRTQRKVARSLRLKKHLVYFPWVRDCLRKRAAAEEVQLEGEDQSLSLFSALEQPIAKPPISYMANLLLEQRRVIEEHHQQQEPLAQKIHDWMERNVDDILGSISSSEDNNDSGNEYVPPQDVNEEEEEEIVAFVPPQQVRKRKPASKKYKGECKRARKNCIVGSCTASVVNITRHVKLCHPEVSPSSVQKKTPIGKVKREYKGRLMCAPCGTSTIRMDIHLINVHKLEKGSVQYQQMMAEASPHVAEDRHVDDLHRALIDFGKSLTDRATGQARKEITGQVHMAAVKFWLPKGLCKDTVMGLEYLGTKDGVVDSHMKEAKVKPATLRVYLHSLVAFIQFLAGSRPWLRHLDLASSQLQTLTGKIKNIAKSLVTDVLKDKVERHSKGDDRLDLEPAQMAEDLEGGRVLRARQLLEESAGRQFSRAELTDIRNCLALQILLANAKRAGDVTHIRKVAILEAESLDGEDTEVEVYEHKEARSGKVCPVRIGSVLLLDLKRYAGLTENTVPYLFQTQTGHFLTPSAMSKLVQTEWARFQSENNLPPTRMTASRHRKLAVTTIRDAGASREDQTLLARHMAHSVETADRYYDRSRQTKGRHAVLDIIQKQYKEALNEDGAGGSRGEISVEERQRNLEELVWARSRVEK